LPLKIVIGTRNSIFRMHSQFGHVPSERFAGLGIGCRVRVGDNVYSCIGMFRFRYSVKRNQHILKQFRTQAVPIQINNYDDNNAVYV